MDNETVEYVIHLTNNKVATIQVPRYVSVVDIQLLQKAVHELREKAFGLNLTPVSEQEREQLRCKAYEYLTLSPHQTKKGETNELRFRNVKQAIK